MHPDAQLGWVHLSVADVERSVAFYEGVLGLSVLRRSPGFVALGVRDGGAGGLRAIPLVLLTHQGGARPKPAGCRGLYHLALRLPTRRDLALALLRVVRRGWPLDGTADHWVSEALYLSDPDGHGVELYADRPQARWPRRGDSILMGTEPLDADGLMAEIPPEERLPGLQEAHSGPGPTQTGMPPGTRLGHVHLHVSRLERAERFYQGALGLNLVFRFGAGALFFAAGGYHHHVGANVWAGPDAPPPPPDAVRLLHYSFLLPSAREVEDLARRLKLAGVPMASLAQLGPQVLELTAGTTQGSREPGPPEGFVTWDEDGQAIAVLSAEVW